MGWATAHIKRARRARAQPQGRLDVDIPRDTLTVITGLSGSGKSSLAFDTIYAEGSAAMSNRCPPMPASFWR
jgi:excinuclease UvrABC ATPase subunit